MKLPRLRDWHGWLAVSLLVPLLLIGLSALFIAHSKALGLREIDVGAVAGWLPGYASAPAAPAEVRSALTLADGTRWLGTRSGAYEVRPGTAPLQHLAGHEVRALLGHDGSLFAATRNGLWQRAEPGAQWRRVLPGEFWSLARDADGTLSATSRDQGIAHSSDGRQWQWENPEALPTLPTAPEKLTLGRLMLDLHTGRAFFGRNGEWIWIDLLGAVWAFLGGSGLYLWWRTQTKRRDAALYRRALTTSAASPQGESA